MTSIITLNTKRSIVSLLLSTGATARLQDVQVYFQLFSGRAILSQHGNTTVASIASTVAIAYICVQLSVFLTKSHYQRLD